MKLDFEKFESEIAALRTALDHGMRERQISKRQFHERFQILERLEQENNRLRKLLVENGKNSELQAPILKTKMNEEEKKFSIDLFENKYLFLSRLEAKLRKASLWCERAEKYSWYKYLIAFKLAWINSEVKKLDSKLDEIDDIDIELNQFIDQLSEHVGPKIFRNNNNDRF